MKRKLIQLGDSSFAVTLPTAWIKKNNLSKSDEVELNVYYDKITIFKEKSKKELKKSTLDLRNKSEKICWFAISNEYMKGVEEFTILCDKNNVELVKKIVDFLVGAVIISETENELIVECISEPSDSLKEKVLDKLVFKMRELVKDAVETLLKERKYPNFKEKDHELNRLFFYSIRALRTQLENKDDEILLVQGFENIMDSFELVVEEGIVNDTLKEFESVFIELTNIYFNREKKQNLLKIYEKVSRLKDKCENKTLKFLFTSFKRTIQMISPIFE
ncbi:MAG: hypothetical protein PWP03_455 [Candidatus Woesearchaeota archaeon]|nr:hypothetical protein [Candidatus Woesearchaeota archaeon]MDN5327817.1 hypothetical protein [Candidatus Woesearchaeota archaeon]